MSASPLFVSPISGTSRSPSARRRAVELDQPAEFRRTLGERLVPDIGLTNKGEADMALLQAHRLGDDELQIEPGRLAAVGRRGFQQRCRTRVLIAKLHAFLPVRAVRRWRHP